MNMILYDRLWETMKAKGMTQYRLIHYYKFSAGQLGRLRKNAYVSTHTIHVLCTILNCSVEDVMEFRKEEAKKEE
ncbi:helix-turn-helix transcriptional regulator [Candidatus Ventrimonas sp. KK005]